VSIVGIGMRSHVGVASLMFRTLSEEGINIQMISTSEIKTSVIINDKYLIQGGQPVEVFERDHRLTVRVELPGIKKEEIGVAFTDGVLTIEGERKFENEEKKNEWYRNERAYGKFVRTVPLPEGVKATDIKATFEGGVLEIAVPLPVTAAAAPTKVEVTGAEEKKTVKAA